MKYFILLTLILGVTALYGTDRLITNFDPADGASGNVIFSRQDYNYEGVDGISIDSWTLKAAGIIGGGRVSGGLMQVSGQYRLYAFGGFSNAHEYYDLTTDSWTACPLPPYTTNNSGFTVCNNKLYIFGSYGSHRHVMVFDPVSNAWTSMADIPTSYCGSYWYASGASPIGGTRIIVAGGTTSNGSGVTTAAIYDTASDSWTAAANMPGGKYYCTASWFNGKAYFIGGYSTSAVVYGYTPGTNTWTTEPALPSAKFSKIASAVNGNGLFAYGGYSTNRLACYALFYGSTTAWQTDEPLPSSYTGGVSPVGGGYDYNLIIAYGGDSGSTNRQCWIGAGHKVGFGNYKNATRKIPENSCLTGVTPNPCRDQIRVGYKLNPSDHMKAVNISVYDLNGRKIATILNEKRADGFHAKFWNGNLATGTYTVVMTIDGKLAGSQRIVRLP
ncbi:MAG: hypothetical protein JXA60_08340 [Candidatus Coatesbacteria bacterium]|nr:hypothetical protein [Candidatus Coatesbacteria bacterium]